MKCPKCKNLIPENAIFCNVCGMKLRISCPVCKSLNRLGKSKCQKCDHELLKYCPVCKAANNPTDKFCRKCHAVLNIQKPTPIPSEVINHSSKQQTHQLPQSAINRLAEAITQKKAEIIVENNTKENTPIQQISKEDETITEQKTEILQQTNEITEANKICTPEENILTTQTSDSPEDIADDTKTLQENNVKDLSESPDTVNIDLEENINTIEEEEISDAFSEFVNNSDEPSEPQQEYVAEESFDDEEYDEETLEDLNFENDIYFQSQRNAQKTLSDLLINSEKYVIGLSGEEGLGKTHVLREVFSEIQSPEQIWLWAECTPLTQVSAMGMLQDAIINLFTDTPLLCSNPEIFKAETKNSFSEEFPSLNSKDIDLLINFLYPHKKSYYENMNANRERTFELLEKVFEELGKKGRIFFVIDDFELIDGSSYDFLCRLLTKGFFNNDFKLIITYRDNRQSEGFITANILPDNAFESVHLGTMTDEETDIMFRNCLSDKECIPENLISQIKENAEGKPAYVESVISYLFETKMLQVEADDSVVVDENIEAIVIPKTISELSAIKLNSMKKENYNAYKVIMLAALLGNKFSIELLGYAANIEETLFEESIRLLIYFGYFRKLNERTFAFKNTLLWQECYKFVKDEEQYKAFNECLYNATEDEILTNNSLKALLVENLELPEKSVHYWTENVKIASYIGDISVYVISQKQCLKYLDKCNFENITKIKNNIYERIGKILSETAPEQAIEFLSNAILVAEEEKNITRIIDIAAYLGQSAQITGNYLGVIEVVDLVLKYIKQDDNPVGCALIKQKKLEALCALGNTAEIVNIVENDIFPPLKEYFNHNRKDNSFDDNLVYSGWIDANLTLAKAYILQGSNKAGEVLDNLSDIIRINKTDNKHFETKIRMVQAMNYTINGNISKSQELLREISQLNYGEKMDDKVRSKWNFICVLNKVFLKQYDKVKAELFDIVTFANNCNDEFTKNILKIILGKIIKESGNITKAIDIYNEQVAYFAKAKVAIGAMLGWYFIVEATLQTEGAEKALEIVQKAFDVAQNPKIDNYYFMTLYNMQMADIYKVKGDDEATKMYIEKALLLAKKYDLLYLKIKLHIMYGKYFENQILKTKDDKKNIIGRVTKNYETALNLAQKLELNCFAQAVQANISQFEAFCKLNHLT